MITWILILLIKVNIKTINIVSKNIYGQSNKK